MKKSSGKRLLSGFSHVDHKYFGCLLIFCVFAVSVSAQDIVTHAHNDYEKPLPLWNALAHNFHSIEIDIARLDQTLRVTHTLDSLEVKPTIQDLYLDPLRSHLDTAAILLWLLVDLKSFDYETLDLLHELIEERDHLFMRRTDTAGSKPLQIILSGNMPRAEIIAEEKYVYFFIDGRIEHLGQEYPTTLMPLISANFNHISNWNGSSEISKSDDEALQELVQRVNAEEKKLRFWKTADSEIVWQELIDVGVHVIGTDDVKRLHSFIQSR